MSMALEGSYGMCQSTVKRSSRNCIFSGVPIVAQWLTNLNRNDELWVGSLALLSGLRIWHCRELWCRLQTLLGSRVAMALA